MNNRDMVTPAELRADADAKAQRDAAKAARRPKVNTSRKGKKGERMVVKLWESIGIASRRQPRSGSIEGLPHDVISTLDDGELSSEVKQRRTSGWKTLDKWRDGADVLFLLEDQQNVGEPAPEPRVFMTWSTLRRLINRR